MRSSAIVGQRQDLCHQPKYLIDAISLYIDIGQAHHRCALGWPFGTDIIDLPLTVITHNFGARQRTVITVGRLVSGHP